MLSTHKELYAINIASRVSPREAAGLDVAWLRAELDIEEALHAAGA
jgi:hypothetical protein